jgi:hypothetical protein
MCVCVCVRERERERERSVPKVPHENFVGRFQHRSREIRYFKTKYWELEFT